jgi:hypothetical protein
MLPRVLLMEYIGFQCSYGITQAELLAGQMGLRAARNCISVSRLAIFDPLILLAGSAMKVDCQQ